MASWIPICAACLIIGAVVGIALERWTRFDDSDAIRRRCDALEQTEAELISSNNNLGELYMAANSLTAEQKEKIAALAAEIMQLRCVNEKLQTLDKLQCERLLYAKAALTQIQDSVQSTLHHLPA